MTHAQKLNLEIVDWVEELSKKEIDWSRLKSLASSWYTCCIGQLHEIIKRDGPSGKPDDLELTVIGEQFNEAVKRRDVEIALIWAKRAKVREAELIAERIPKMKDEIKELTAYLKEQHKN